MVCGRSSLLLVRPRPSRPGTDKSPTFVGRSTASVLTPHAVAPGALEVFWENKYPASECAGNFGVPWVTSDPAKMKEIQLAELKNGRLAMIGIISFACAESIPGSVPFYPF